MVIPTGSICIVDMHKKAVETAPMVTEGWSAWPLEARDQRSKLVASRDLCDSNEERLYEGAQ